MVQSRRVQKERSIVKSFADVARSPRIFWLTTIVAAFLVFIIAMVFGLSQSTWFDEGYSILLAQQPVGELIALTSVDAHPPLYYLLLKAWITVFGLSDISLRASSALCGALAIVAVALLLRKLFTAKVAIATLPFLVLAPFMLRYDYEIRMYALVLLIGVVATYALVKARESSRTAWWVVYGALVAIGMYTLYMSVVFWLAHLTWLLMQDKFEPFKKMIRRPYILSYIGAFAAFAPWVPTVVMQLLHSALPPFMSAVTIREIITILGMTLSFTSFSRLGAWVSLGIVIWLIVFVVAFVKVWRKASKQFRSGILLLSLCFVVGIIFYTLISLPPNPPRFMERYAIHLSVFMYALIGVLSALSWRYGMRRIALSLGAISLVLLSYGTIHLANTGNYNLQRAQSMQARTVRETYGCDNTTYVTAGPFGYIDMSYEMRDCDLRFYYPNKEVFRGGYAPLNDSQDRIASSKGITADQLIFVYFEESTDIMTPDTRYTLAAERRFDKTMVKVYQRR